MNDLIQTSREQGIVRVVLNRPEKRNALNMDLFSGIDRTIKSLHRDRSVRAVIVSGAGEDFCSGLDIKSMLSNRSAVLKLLGKWLPGNANLAQRVSIGWRKIPAPVIFALHGRCWGGGLQIALGGDFRIASPDCSLAIMETRWGIVPDMAGNVALRGLVAKDQAMRWAMHGGEIAADEALRHGLLTAIADDPLAAADELAATFSNRSPDAVGAIKRIYHANWERGDRHMLAAETLAQLRMFRTRNQRIAVQRETGQPELAYRDRQR